MFHFVFFIVCYLSYVNSLVPVFVKKNKKNKKTKKYKNPKKICVSSCLLHCLLSFLCELFSSSFCKTPMPGCKSWRQKVEHLDWSYLPNFNWEVYEVMMNFQNISSDGNSPAEHMSKASSAEQVNE